MGYTERKYSLNGMKRSSILFKIWDNKLNSFRHWKIIIFFKCIMLEIIFIIF